MKSQSTLQAAREAALAKTRTQFARIEAVSFENTSRVLEAFRNNRVSDAHFAGTNGYGYNDLGRDTLDKIYAEVFGAEAALVRVQFVNGTHAIACALFACLSPGDMMVSLTGKPYDTLETVINGGHGSLKSYGIGYSDKPADIKTAKAVYIQRSRGYTERKALSVADIDVLIKDARSVNPNVIAIVDNCYGEFTETREPCSVGADLIAGSLIKNPGGGLAPCGGYIAGRAELVERAAEHLTVPGLGAEVGASLAVNRALYQGLYMAPHATGEALKTAVYAAALFAELGYAVSPAYDEHRSDIIQTIELGSPERVLAFCKGLQSGLPVDSFVTPLPWDMPGYAQPVIMAAGGFVQGGSLELSADAPMRPPYRVYVQGGVTFDAGRYGIDCAVNS
ncbi:MAG: methionine gamma-lyase family protein [Oscillospiraceae bacterium]|jgi:cystathionine beta-lyase family protein involved in aluminum resistance|nr:methionine gamma-lyase family protein [Oscillospiraceae bacterium]